MWKNRLFYLILLFVTIFLSIMYFEPFPVLLLILEILIPFALLCFLIPSISRLRINYRVEKEYYEIGEPVKVQIVIKTNLMLPISYLQLHCYFHNFFTKKIIKQKITMSVAAGGVINNEIVFTPEKCGRVRFEVKKAKVMDFFGLFCFYKKVRNPIDITVLPKLLFMEAELTEKTKTFRIDSDEFDPHKPGDDPSEIFQIREYKSGDRLQRVHWKLSVKADNLFVKDLSKPIGWPVLVMVDLRNERDVNEKIYQIVAAISCTLSQLPCRHILTWYDEKSMKAYQGFVRGEEDVVEEIKELLQNSYATRWILEMFEKEFVQAAFSHLIYITNQKTIDEIAKIGESPLSKHKTIFYLNQNGSSNNELKSVLNTYNMTLLDLDEKTLEEDLLATYLYI